MAATASWCKVAASSRKRPSRRLPALPIPSLLERRWRLRRFMSKDCCNSAVAPFQSARRKLTTPNSCSVAAWPPSSFKPLQLDKASLRRLSASPSCPQYLATLPAVSRVSACPRRRSTLISLLVPARLPPKGCSCIARAASRASRAGSNRESAIDMQSAPWVSSAETRSCKAASSARSSSDRSLPPSLPSVLSRASVCLPTA